MTKVGGLLLFDALNDANPAVRRAFLWHKYILLPAKVVLDLVPRPVISIRRSTDAAGCGEAGAI